MKRTREEIVGVDMEKVIMLLSCSFETKFTRCSSSPNDVFECKTCSRQFPSFQALGGHRASHNKKPRTLSLTLTGSGDQESKSETKLLAQSSKAKRHECSICGREFSTGQALGGHMRSHRMMMNAGISSKIPVLMRSNSSKRVMCLDMDLNLTPLENDLKVLFGNLAPKVDTLIS